MFSTVLIGGVFSDAMVGTLTKVLFIAFVVIGLGFMLGRINIKGVSLGSSGVFIVALIAGIILSNFSDQLGIKWDGKSEALRTIRDLGLGMFVAGIGLISGPTFLHNLKKNALSCVGIGASIIVTGTIICILLVLLDKTLEPYQGAGILMGALSSTPGLASAQGVFEEQSQQVAALSGLAYPFGVLGVVFFVQLMPKLLRVDMQKEIQIFKDGIKNKTQKVNSEGEIEASEKPKSGMVAADETQKPAKKAIKFDTLGICIFSFVVALGMLVGAITIPLGGSMKFSLGTTGGALLMGLLVGHFGKAGRISLEVPKKTVGTLRELGLVFFLTCSGIEGGFNFLAEFKWQFLIYGMILTTAPMVVGFVLAKFAFKMQLLNNLGSMCGGMTSTPALGALIHVSGTDEVAQSYAATYPIALLLLVFVPQVIYLVC